MFVCQVHRNRVKVQSNAKGGQKITNGAKEALRQKGKERRQREQPFDFIKSCLGTVHSEAKSSLHVLRSSCFDTDESSRKKTPGMRVGNETKFK